MAITDLTNTTWIVPAGWSAPAGYGEFIVNITSANYGFSYLRIGYKTNVTAGDFGPPEFSTTPTANYISVDDNFANYDYYTPTDALSLTFADGIDVTNQSLISWLEANGELQGGDIPTDKVSVLYKGELIGTIEQNNEGIIGCNGETMEDDITIRVPAIGVGATVYSIDWDTSDLSTVAGLDILFLPTSICAGQTVAGVIFAGNIIVNASNCDIHEKTVTVPNYEGLYSGTLTVIEVSNPTGDINIVVARSHGGGSN